MHCEHIHCEDIHLPESFAYTCTFHDDPLQDVNCFAHVTFVCILLMDILLNIKFCFSCNTFCGMSYLPLLCLVTLFFIRCLNKDKQLSLCYRRIAIPIVRIITFPCH